MTEKTIHKEFYQLVARYDSIEPFLFKIEPGVPLNIKIAMALKYEGLKGGVADYLYYKKNSKGQILWIEFKYGKNKQTQKQKDFEELVKINRDKYALCYTAESAIYLLQKHNKE